MHANTKRKIGMTFTQWIIALWSKLLQNSDSDRWIERTDRGGNDERDGTFCVLCLYVSVSEWVVCTIICSNSNNRNNKIGWKSSRLDRVVVACLLYEWVSVSGTTLCVVYYFRGCVCVCFLLCACFSTCALAFGPCVYVCGQIRAFLFFVHFIGRSVGRSYLKSKSGMLRMESLRLHIGK